MAKQNKQAASSEALSVSGENMSNENEELNAKEELNANSEELITRSRSASNNSVHVMLNHPHGIEFPMSDGTSVTLRGNATRLVGLEKGQIPVGLYGKTLISTEQWEYIKKTYGQMAIFRNGLCFAAADPDSARDEAEDRAELRHGREPVDTSKTVTKPVEGKVE